MTTQSGFFSISLQKVVADRMVIASFLPGLAVSGWLFFAVSGQYAFIALQLITIFVAYMEIRRLRSVVSAHSLTVELKEAATGSHNVG
jgi:hypothetical protein